MKNILLELFNKENDFFKLTSGSKRLTHIAFSSFLLPVVFIIIAGLLTKYIFSPILLQNPKEISNWIKEIFALFFIFGIIIALVFLWIIFYERRSIRSLGFSKNDPLKKYISGFFIGIVINSAVVIILIIFGNVEFSNIEPTTNGLNTLFIVSIYFFGFLIQGAGEEILSRGWIFQVIGSRYKPWLGLLISTLFFTILHMGNTGINPISILNLILISIMLSLFVMKDGSLWRACAIHSSWNWTLGNVYGLSVSGHKDSISIINLDTFGNDLISGGGFGPEGSLITSLVIIVTILFISQSIITKNKSAVLDF